MGRLRYNNNEDIFLFPAKKKAKATLIWMHGLGDSAHGFLPVFSQNIYGLNLDDIKFVLVNAPERPVTMNNYEKMRSWWVSGYLLITGMI